jgi:hypothetical protein
MNFLHLPSPPASGPLGVKILIGAQVEWKSPDDEGWRSESVLEVRTRSYTRDKVQVIKFLSLSNTKATPVSELNGTMHVCGVTSIPALAILTSAPDRKQRHGVSAAVLQLTHLHRPAYSTLH